MRFLRLIIFSFLISHLSFSAFSQPLSAVWPKPDLVTPEYDIEFAWNLYPGGNQYTLHVSNTPGFETLVIDQTLSGQTYSFTFSNPGQFFWKVGVDVGSANETWSSAYTFTIFSPSQLPNLVLWLDASEAVVDGSNRVSQWTDKSGLGHHVSQNTVELQPLRITNTLNGKPVIRFDGVNDYLDGGNILNLDLNSRTSAIVGRNSKTNGSYFAKSIAGNNLNRYGFLYENSKFFFIYHDNSNRTLSTQHNTGSNEILTAITNRANSTNRLFQNGTLLGNGIINASHSLTNNFNFFIGAYNNNTGLAPLANYYLQGDMAELIIYHFTLSEIQRYQLESYFRFKFFPTQYQKLVNLGFDLLNETFCMISLNAGEGYSNYFWNTGATTSSIIVSEPGTYSVTVTDQFGFQSTDQVNVSFPNRLLNEIPNEFCAGESQMLYPLIVNAGLYTYEWSNGQTTHSIEITETGNYWVKITDDQGCFAYSDTVSIFVDQFATSVSLGPDLQLCAGNEIGLVPQPENWQNLEYLWSNGAATPKIPIFESGIYSVEVTNENGCTGSFEVFVEIIGTAPSVDFSANTICFGNATEFLDLSIPAEGDALASWQWTFEPGISSTEQNPAVVFSEPGIFQVSLEVSAASGCVSSITKPVEVKGLPQAFFEAEPGCVGVDMHFIDQSIPAPGANITSWTWSFGDGFSSTQNNPTHTYESGGFYEIILVVNDDFGCTDQYQTLLEVVESAPLPGGLSLIFPKNNSVVSDATVQLQWNDALNASQYRLEVSLSPAFSTLVLDTIITQNTFSFQFSGNQAFYWRVTALNLCLQEVVSETFNFRFFSPSSLNGLELWLRADAGLNIQNNRIVSWQDQSASGYIFSQSIEANRPILQNNALINKPSLKFDGNQFLNGGDILDLLDKSRTIFSITKVTAGNSSIFAKSAASGATNRYAHFFDQNNFTFLFHDVSVRNIVTPLTFGNFQIFHTETNRILNQNFLRVNNILYGSVNIQPGHVMASDFLFLIGAYGNSTGGVPPTGTLNLKGEIAEIIFFDRVLTDEENDLMNRYIQTRYSPPVNLGPDKRTAYGFCPVVLDAGDRFSSYLWSTGETTPSITVNEPGSYSVTVTDIFGFVSSDEVRVVYPEFELNITEETICVGEEIVVAVDSRQSSENSTSQLLNSSTLQLLNPSTSQLLNFSTLPSQLLNSSTPYSYLWNTGETTPEIIVSEDGIYTLQITDTLGCSRVLSAVVHVDRFSETATLGEDRPFCLGAELSLIVSEDLKSEIVNRALRELTEGNHQSLIKNLPPTPSKGGVNPELPTSNSEPSSFDSSTLRLFDSSTNISYTWNTGATTPSIIVNETGTYWVNAINENGCLATDTVTLSFQGYNPDPNFEVEPECPSIPLEFVDLSSVSDGTIVSWFWDFGDGFTSTEQHPLHVPERAPGFADVSLTVTTDAGCVNAAVQPVRVYYDPVVHFSPNNACSGVPVVFTDQSTDPDGFGLTAWAWDFGPLGSSSQQNPAVTFEQAGSAMVNLAVTSAKGCSSSITREVTIRQSPDIAFEWTTACVGEPVAFADLGVQPPWVTITGREWRFGDGTASTQLNPTHLYPDDGIYPVTLSLTALNGCTISLTQEVTVHSLPEVDFAADDLCARAPHTFTDLSTVENSHLTAWQWTFGAQGAASEQHPVFTFVEAGIYPVTLQATSAAGCTGNLTRMVQVNPTPQAGFSFFPRYGVAPLPITFSNTSAGAASYLWDFGDGSPLSAQASPTHTYTANGIYYPQLIAYTSLGCPDTTRQELKVIPLSVDVAVTNVAYTLQGGFMEVRANILNLGTRDLDTLWLDLHLAGTTPLREQWTGLLRGGDIITYTFRARLPVRDINEHDYLCVTASIPGIEADDNPTNDQYCLTFSSGFRVLEPRPNPAFSEVTVPFILPYEGPVQIALYDLYGNIISNQQTTTAPAGLNFVTLPVHYLRSGTYYVRVIFREEVGVKKVVKL